jgi:flagellar motor switch protein FliG
MSIKTLTGLNKAAVLLICLGEEATSKVFQELTDDEIRQVTRTMATIDHIPEGIKDKVFANYAETQRELAGLFVKGADFAKKAISSAGSDERTA